MPAPMLNTRYAPLLVALKSFLRKKKGVACVTCSDRIFSWYGHDFNSCKCKETFVDGGGNYLRVGYKHPPKNIVFVQRDMARAIERCIEMNIIPRPNA